LHRKRCWGRRLFLGFAVFALVFALFLAAHPWWLGPLARHLLEREGVTVQSIRSHGFAALELTGISADIEGTGLQADRAVVALPVAWLMAVWRDVAFLDRAPLKGNLVTVDGWTVTLSPDPAPATDRDAPPPPAELFGDVLEITDVVSRILPRARLSAGEFWADALVVAVAEMSWRAGHLELAATFPEIARLERLQATVERSGEGFALKGQAFPTEGGAVSFSGLAELLRDALHFSGETDWGAWQVGGTAVWDGADWIPGRAEGHFSGGDLPSPIAALLPPAVVEHATGTFSWDEGQWSARSSGSGEWREPESAETLDWTFDLAASGDTRRARFAELHVDLPFLRMRLSEPVEVSWPAWQLSDATTWTVEADLSRLPQHPLDAAFRGQARFAPRDLEDPAAGMEWEIEGALLARLAETDWEPALSASGTLDQERATIARLSLALPEGTVLSASGIYTFSENTLTDGSAEGTLIVSELAPLLPDIEWPFARLSAQIEADGPIGSLRHGGIVEASDVRVEPFLPVGAVAEWTGLGAERLDGSLRVHRENAVARTEVRIVQTAETAWQIEAKALTVGEEKADEGVDPHIRLAAPMSLTLALTDGPPAIGWSAFRLESPDGFIEAGSGHFRPDFMEIGETRAESLDIAWVAQWLEEITVPDLFVETLRLAAQSDADGRVTGLASARVFLVSADYGVEVDIEALPESVRIETLRALRAEGELFRLRGTLPVFARREADGRFAYDLAYRAPLSVEAEVDGESVLSDWIGELTGIYLERGTARFALGGTLSQPKGEIRLSAHRLRYQAEGFEEVTFLEPALHLILDDAEMEIVRADFSLPGMTGRADLSGQLKGLDWEKILRGDWEAATQPLHGRIALRAFPLAAVAGFLPEILEPRGSLQGAVYLATGRELTGEVDLRGAALRPFEDGSNLRDIYARLTFDGTEVTFPDMRAQWNGRPAQLDGKADLATWPDPTFSIRARGENLDLVRREDLLLRADIDLRLERPRADQPPLIRGEVGLRNSLFLQDFRDLIRPGAAGVETRPPYFRVEDELFRDWRLDVRVSGREFLRLQSTLMRGRVSADFRLSGDLGTPLAIGQVRVTDGALLFPFGRIRLGRAEAAVTLEQPNSLQLSATGTGQAFGYNLSLFLGGTAERPQLELTSVPSLGQEAILLMLATGALPETEETDFGARGGRFALYLGQDFFSLLLGGGAAENIRIRSGDSFLGGGQATAIEYIISDRWSVIGEYNEFEDYNVDLRWRVFRR
jgi:translocation and assembly module TamB